MKHAPHNPEVPTLGQLIRRERERQCLSLQKLADLVPMHKSYLGRIETDDFRQPSPEYLQKIARALALPYTDLFVAVGYQVPEGLPSLEPYLRSRYGVSEDDARLLREHLEKVRTLGPGGTAPKASRHDSPPQQGEPQ